MLIDFEKILEEHKIKVKGIIHVGACMGEEYEYYSKFTDNVIWIEANPELIPIIQKRVNPKQPIYNFAISDKDFERTKFNIIYSDDRTNPGCSSLLDLKLHSVYYPMIKKIKEVEVTTITLDTLMETGGNIGHYRKHGVVHPMINFNILNMDIQGAELLALNGANLLLNYIDLVYTEFSLEELYEGCAQFPELNAKLEYEGFKLIGKEMPHKSWGDAVYVRQPRMFPKELQYSVPTENCTESLEMQGCCGKGKMWQSPVDRAA